MFDGAMTVARSARSERSGEMPVLQGMPNIVRSAPSIDKGTCEHRRTVRAQEITGDCALRADFHLC